MLQNLSVKQVLIVLGLLGAGMVIGAVITGKDRSTASIDIAAAAAQNEATPKEVMAFQEAVRIDTDALYLQASRVSYACYSIEKEQGADLNTKFELQHIQPGLLQEQKDVVTLHRPQFVCTPVLKYKKEQ